MIVRSIKRLRHLPHLLYYATVKAWHDRILGISAEAAFWQMLSLPSLLLTLIASLGYVCTWLKPGTADRIELKLDSTLSRAFSTQVVNEIIAPMLHEVLTNGRADVISIAFVTTIWAGSSAMATFVNTITIAYGMRSQRGAVQSRLLALWLFLGAMAIGVIALPMLVLGPSLLTRTFPERDRHTLSWIVQQGYYPVIILLLMLGLSTLYHLAPPRRLPWRRGIPGAVLALLIFLAGSAALRSYISYIMDHNHAYGTLASPIAALLFFYILALGVHSGAEFNAAIEELSPTPIKPPRVLRPKGWEQVTQPAEAAAQDSLGSPS